MASYGYTPPRYGVGSGVQRPRPITAPRPNDRAGMMGAAPFPTLASGAVRSGMPSGANVIGQGVRPGGNVAPRPAPAAAPRAATQPAVNTAPLAPTVAYDYSADPVLNQIQAIGVQDRAGAEANALRLKKQLAIDYGDVDLANQLGDTNTAQAAAGNPFSVQQQLKTSYETGQRGLEDALNKANLFYSGHRVNQLGELANQYQGQQAGAVGNEQAALGQIGDQLAQALSGANARDVQGQQDAAGRALQIALAQGFDPGMAAPTPETAAPIVAPAAPPAEATRVGAIPNAVGSYPGSVVSGIPAQRGIGGSVVSGIPDELAYALGLANRRRRG